MCGHMDGTLRLWDLEAQESQELPKQYDIWVTSVALNANGMLALSGDMTGKLVLWTTSDSQARILIDGGVPVITVLELSGDGRKGLTGFNTTPVTLLWNVGKAIELPGHSDGISAAVISADGGNAITGDEAGTLLLWDLESVESRRVGEGMGPVAALAIDESATLGVCAAQDSKIALLDLESGEVIASFIGDSPPKACALGDQDGPVVFVCEQSGNIHVLRLEAGESA